ncbi:DUF3027 domain-containing protein [Cellulomonas gelida]|uniref:DUF3027 domain-containing protein n=1 Tax=Cellulomonas gelida TaxID=1712 RepID=A0A4Y3KMP3_9CELL|nr:DUF3027 domain-containing protein [Cellulomonas gelida]GEA85312.1 hypothetical protein CGE01nite_25630 [Cellulomonas gelida]GGL17003.1 hypothetical protein GCM10009774_04230 [Cellulomonas gelida]
MATATRIKDAVLGSAVDLAREVAIEIAVDPSDVGEHLGVVVEGERLVSHRFACLSRGYRGWEWTVTVARVPRGRTATVCEAELLPGPDAILGQAWVPWSERLRPGDIGPGDVLPFRADDPRLEPGWTRTGDPELDEVAIDELALARVRVLAPQGRDEAAERWYRGSRGPTSPGSLASAGACWSCGFLVPLQGALGTVFGVCANEWSPDDGRVVSLDHGCGAHSETDVDPAPSDWPKPDPLIDELRVELVDLAPAADEPAAVEPTSDEAASDEVAVVEELAVVEPTPDEAAGVESGFSELALAGSPTDEPAVVEPAADEAPLDEAPLDEVVVDEVVVDQGVAVGLDDVSDASGADAEPGDESGSPDAEQ